MLPTSRTVSSSNRQRNALTSSHFSGCSYFLGANISLNQRTDLHEVFRHHEIISGLIPSSPAVFSCLRLRGWLCGQRLQLPVLGTRRAPHVLPDPCRECPFPWEGVHGERMGKTFLEQNQSGHTDPQAGEPSWTASYRRSLEDCLIVKYLCLFSR